MCIPGIEIGSLKAIILLNPDSRGLHYPEQVLAIREKLYASLEAYCKVSISRIKMRGWNSGQGKGEVRMKFELG